MAAITVINWTVVPHTLQALLSGSQGLEFIVDVQVYPDSFLFLLITIAKPSGHSTS